MLDLRPPDEFGPDADDGAYWGVPEKPYHSHPALSRSVVAEYIDKSPRHAQHKWGQPYEESDPSLGTTMHDRVLRPGVFEERYAQAPDECEGTTSKDKPCSNSPQFRVDGSWRCRYHGDEEEADDLFRLTESRAETVAGMMESIQSDNLAHSLLGEAAETEVTLLWTDPDTGVRLRARIDALHAFPVGDGTGNFDVADLKTCGSAHPEDVGRQLYKTGSWLQPAFYGRGLEVLSGGCPVEHFFFVLVETAPPHVVQIYELDRVQHQRARQRLRSVLREIESFGETWPAYGANVDEVEIPRWATGRLDLPPAEVPNE